MIVARICRLESCNSVQQGCSSWFWGRERERRTLEIRLYATMSLRDILRLKVDKFFVEKCWVYGIKMSFLFFGWREAFSRTKRKIRIKYENVLFFF